jgi:hypothetical protein
MGEKAPGQVPEGYGKDPETGETRRNASMKHMTRMALNDVFTVVGVGHEVPLGCLKTLAFVSGCSSKYQKAVPDPER